ncbi:sirohydrochlorin chelatase [Amycolatopsis antarctica]|uniref:Sirohydrochlorin chelatase n=1 Tax=Amycolatopsis antarctica TaxID=1854586 RepID=A0A263D7W3_9PSEU|nr:sirohydrochlorin chelatase [Amycolatopsis antarctica]OZM74279.1 sirohydrochlorin chelatase [Amycolatopsis antarctica]
MTAPPLVLVAHGSRDPRSAATVRALAAVVRDTAPGTDVRVAFLDLSDPPVPEVLREAHADGHREVVVVPLLLGSAYHARVDLPAIVAETTAAMPRLRVRVAEVLGADPLLEAVACDRLADAGADMVDPELGVLVSAVGSSRPEANEAVAAIARRWRARRPGGGPVVPAFASTAAPDVPAAVTALRAHGARRIAVASWFLAPGLLPDRIALLARTAEPDVLIAGPLAAEPRVAEVVLRRYGSAMMAPARTA